MTATSLRTVFPCLLTLVFFLPSALISAQTQADQPLLSIDSSFDVSSLESREVNLSVIASAEGPAIQIQSKPNKDWPGITVRPTKSQRDMSQFDFIAVDVLNKSDREVTFAMRVDSVDSEQATNSQTEQQTIAAGKQGTIRMSLARKIPKHLEGRLMGMRSNPDLLTDETGLAADAIDQIILFFFKQPNVQTVEISNLRVGGEYNASVWLDPNVDPFPMIDSFGQYMHKDWPGKIHSLKELADQKIADQRDLAEHPPLENWNKFGGYADGPKFAASQHFYVKKYQDRWWLIDPEGNLFWSHGIDCVNSNNATTPITDREFYFTDLPRPGSPLAAFYGHGNWAPHGYYKDRGQYRTYNFTGANLFRKYGPDWQTASRDLTHQRLRSWGLNTIANWSERSIYSQKQTPYVVTCNSGGRSIEGSEGYWGKFPDPFDPAFAESIRKQMQWHADDANSPWCIGIFVDNELAWGDELSLAQAALASPPDQFAKLALIDDLKSKYRSIDSLNQAWDTTYQSWDALLESREKPAVEKAGDDLRAFYTHVAEEYFRNCREAVKSVAPDTLYLGCRFAWVNDRAVRAAAEYCDVIAFNRYEYSIADYKLPSGIDKPAIIGEYHFGALDRGLFHTGLKPTESQQARADAYRSYVRGALKNPIWVGAHWFQYGDQAATGRGDGENYQIGFVDVCDTPYKETIEAAREIAEKMYSLRLEP